MNAKDSNLPYYPLNAFMFQRLKSTITNGEMDATIIQNAEGQGKKAVGVVIKAAKEGEVEERYEVPLELIK